jgi:glycosyltransferase involved in cell wall biosynthesis
MRILIVDHNVVYQILSGKSVLDFAKSLDGAISLDFVFNRETELSCALIDLGFNVYIYRHGNSAYRIVRIFGFLFALIKILFLLLHKNYSVLHANNVMAGRLVVISGWLMRKKRVLHIRNPSIPKRQLWLLYLADTFYCVSEYVKKSVIPSDLWHKCRIVYDGFEIDVKFTSRVKNFEKPLTVGMLSRISYQKGIHLFGALSEEFGRNELRFVHMGGSRVKPLAGSYEHGVIESYMGVEWIPYKSNTEEFFDDIDVFILTAVEDEAFGRVLIESMARGIPCICTKCGGPEELIEHGVTGLLAEPTLEDLRVKLENIMRDVNLREELGRSGMEYAIANFCIDAYRDRILTGYH